MKRVITIATAALALVVVSTALGSGPIKGKVRGVFVRGPYDGTIDQAHLKRYIRTTNVWCAWQDGKVLVHVRMRNGSAEHVTVNWYPRYRIRAGGIHGDGFSSAQSNGFDAGEVRELIAKQDPKGVRDYSPIAKCYPHFQMIESG